jgi:hypothetical protein
MNVKDAEIQKRLEDHQLFKTSMYYEFNDQVANNEDTDYWTFGSGAGANNAIDPNATGGDPPSKVLKASKGDAGAQNDECYIHGDGKYAIAVSPAARHYSTVYMETKLKLANTADCQAFWGLDLVGAMTAAYAEPAHDSIIFFCDDGVGANFMCRTYDAAEEETSSGIALDTSWHIYRIEWRFLSSPSVTFRIDGSVVSGHVTQVPNSALAPMYIVKTQEATGDERSITREYCWLWGE